MDKDLEFDIIHVNSGSVSFRSVTISRLSLARRQLPRYLLSVGIDNRLGSSSPGAQGKMQYRFIVFDTER